jgi:hypothetical protein
MEVSPDLGTLPPPVWLCRLLSSAEPHVVTILARK